MSRAKNILNLLEEKKEVTAIMVDGKFQLLVGAKETKVLSEKEFKSLLQKIKPVSVELDKDKSDIGAIISGIKKAKSKQMDLEVDSKNLQGIELE